MEDYYLAASIQREEQEEIENRRLMSEIERACAETEAKTLSGDADNEEMGEVVVKNEEDGDEMGTEGDGEGEREGKGEGEAGKEGEKREDEGMGEVKEEESMTEDKPSNR